MSFGAALERFDPQALGQEFGRREEEFAKRFGAARSKQLAEEAKSGFNPLNALLAGVAGLATGGLGGAAIGAATAPRGRAFRPVQAGLGGATVGGTAGRLFGGQPTSEALPPGTIEEVPGAARPTPALETVSRAAEGFDFGKLGKDFGGAVKTLTSPENLGKTAQILGAITSPETLPQAISNIATIEATQRKEKVAVREKREAREEKRLAKEEKRLSKESLAVFTSQVGGAKNLRDLNEVEDTIFTDPALSAADKNLALTKVNSRRRQLEVDAKRKGKADPVSKAIANKAIANMQEFKADLRRTPEINTEQNRLNILALRRQVINSNISESEKARVLKLTAEVLRDMTFD